MKLVRFAGLTALVSMLGAGALSGAQEVRVTSQTMVTNPLGGPGPGGGLNPIPQGTGLILGQAVDGGSNRPVPGALVTLGLPNARPIRALADSQGRFVFRDLPKGRFTLSATKAGYVEGAYGRMRPSGPTLLFELADGERASGASIALWRYAAVAGFVVDEHGEPVVGTTVRVMRRQIVSGQWRFVPGPQDQTDDRGSYRIGTLEPGEYVISIPMAQTGNLGLEGLVAADLDKARDVIAVAATSVRVGAAGAEGGIFLEGLNSGSDAAGVDENGRPLTYPTLFYPNVNTAARATIARLASGEERTGLDFQLRPVRALKVSGTAVGPSGPMGNLALTLVPVEAETLGSAFDTRTAFTGPNGEFSFTSVPPGQYVLRGSRSPRVAFEASNVRVIQQGNATMTFTAIAPPAGSSPPLPTEPTLWTEIAVPVGTSDVTDLTLALRPGLKVAGTVQFDGGTQRPESDRLSSISVTLEPADVRPGISSVRGRIEYSGQFATMGVPPGRYFVRVSNAPQGWTFRGATLGGRDVTDAPLEIEGDDVNGVLLAFTDRPIDLTGQVTTDSASTDLATVIVFPTDRSMWVGYGSGSRRLRSVRADKTGAYTVANLPAGDYYVAAVADKGAVDWQNPDFLASLAQEASRVRLAEGQKGSQNVKVIR
jgi:hypothetical protein